MVTDGKEVVKRGMETFYLVEARKVSNNGGNGHGKNKLIGRAQRVADMRSLISVMQLQAISSSVLKEESNKLKKVMVHFWLSKVGVVGDPLLKSMWRSSCTTNVAKTT